MKWDKLKKNYGFFKMLNGEGLTQVWAVGDKLVEENKQLREEFDRVHKKYDALCTRHDRFVFESNQKLEALQTLIQEWDLEDIPISELNRDIRDFKQKALEVLGE